MHPLLPAALAAAQGESPFALPILMIAVFAGMYFFMIRPQNKRQKEHQQMVAGIGKGDEVVTVSGILGRVKDVGEQFITLEIASGVEVKLQKQAVGNVLPKGTLKNI